MERRTVERLIAVFQETLVDFGYKSLTFEQTVEATKKALQGIGNEPDKGGCIICLFIKDWLENEFKHLRPLLLEYFGISPENHKSE